MKAEELKTIIDAGRRVHDLYGRYYIDMTEIRNVYRQMDACEDEAVGIMVEALHGLGYHCEITQRERYTQRDGITRSNRITILEHPEYKILVDIYIAFSHNRTPKYYKAYATGRFYFVKFRGDCKTWDRITGKNYKRFEEV